MTTAERIKKENHQDINETEAVSFEESIKMEENIDASIVDYSFEDGSILTISDFDGKVYTSA